MTVRLRHWKQPDGTQRETWCIDVSVRQPNGIVRRVQLRSPTQTKAGAHRFERQVLEELKRGTFGVQVRRVPTLAQAVEDYMAWSQARNNKPSTLQAKRVALRTHLLPFMATMRLSDIKAADVEALRAHVERQGKAPKTVREVLVNLKTILKFAVERGYREQVPKFHMPKTVKPEQDWLDAEECERFLEAADYWPERYPYLLLALDTGMRAGELLALRWQDIDFSRKQIHVRRTLVQSTRKYGTPKSGHTRVIGVTTRALEALRAAKHLRGELVFCHHDGKPFQHGHTQGWAAAACKRAGLAKAVSTHELRHTCCARMVMADVNAAAIKEHFGWASDEMLRRYTHLSPSHMRSAIEKLEAFDGKKTEREARR